MIPAPQPPGVSPQVQAVYTFDATVETQLSFKEGDILALMGEKSEGWQYGQNTRTGRYCTVQPVYNMGLFIPPAVYRGYIVFEFSVKMFVCVCV